MSVISFSRDKRGPDDEFRKIRKQARHWVIRLDGEEFADDEKQALASWLALSPQHRKIFYETAATWLALDQLDCLMGELEQPGPEDSQSS